MNSMLEYKGYHASVEYDKEFKGTFNIRIPPEMHKRAALEAANQKITLNQFVLRAIHQSLESGENMR